MKQEEDGQTDMRLQAHLHVAKVESRHAFPFLFYLTNVFTNNFTFYLINV